MSLKLVKIERFQETVKVVRPTDELNVTREESFQVVYRHVGSKEFDEMMDKVKSGELNNEGLLRRVVLEIKEIYDADGKMVDTATCLDYICDNLDLSSAVVTKFVESLHGAKAKNSNGSRRG